MYKLKEIIIIVIIIIVLIFIYNQIYKNTEGFKVDSQNWPYQNTFNTADLLEYGSREPPGIYSNQLNNNDVMGPSSLDGVNQNSPVDIFDNRGYKWTKNAKDPKINEFTDFVDNIQLRKEYERTYMLDPSGSVAQYDLSNNNISPSCCPAQYSPPFKLTDKDSTNCDFAQKYVANQYSGMNFNDGYGCACITPSQADFYGSRGGNTD